MKLSWYALAIHAIAGFISCIVLTFPVLLFSLNLHYFFLEILYASYPALFSSSYTIALEYGALSAAFLIGSLIFGIFATRLSKIACVLLQFLVRVLFRHAVVLGAYGSFRIWVVCIWLTLTIASLKPAFDGISTVLFNKAVDDANPIINILAFIIGSAGAGLVGAHIRPRRETTT